MSDTFESIANQNGKKGGKHYVTVRTFPPGSTLYVCHWQACANYYFSVANGKIADITLKVPAEHLNYLGSRNKYGQRAVMHYYAEGNICMLPKTSRNYEIKPQSVSLRTSKFLAYGHDVYLDNKFIWRDETYSENKAYVFPKGYVTSQYMDKGDSGLVYTYFDYNTKYTTVRGRTTQELSCTVLLDENGVPNQNTWTETNSILDQKGPTSRIWNNVGGFVNLGTVLDDGSTAYNAVADVLGKVKLGVPFPPDTFMSDLCDQVGAPQVNSVENLKDLKDFRKMMPPVLDIIKKRNPKSVAELILWYKYSYSTTKMDIEEFINWFKQIAYDRGEFKTSDRFSRCYKDGNGDYCRYEIFIEPQTIGILRALGFDLNTGNLWDLVPFSFVIDWFVGFGDVFESLDSRDVCAELKLKSFVSSCKRTRQYDAGKLTSGLYSGVISTSSYTRYVESELPVTYRSLTLNNPLDHFVSGTSLYIALRKR